MKKIKNLAIVFALIMAISALSGCGTNDNNADKGNNTNQTQTDKNSITNTSSYTKGTFDGATYINEWADIKLELPDGFSNADLATYNTAESSNTECGMYFMADDTMGLIYICYEKLPSFPVYNEEKYLDSAMKSLQNVSGVTYEIPKIYTTAKIGGYSYAKAECVFNNSNGNFANTFYVRKLDNYMIVISVIGIDSGSNDALVNCITTAK